MTNALHTYVDCDWLYICKGLWKVNKYDMIRYDFFLLLLFIYSMPRYI